LNYRMYIEIAAHECNASGQWPALTTNSNKGLRSREQYLEKPQASPEIRDPLICNCYMCSLTFI
jgi:hypothetical protein